MQSIQTTFDRQEDGLAVLTADIGGRLYRINLAVQLLPADAKPGDIFYLTLSRGRNQTAASKQTAKELLNEILTGKTAD